jgi:hypothetical protein
MMIKTAQELAVGDLLINDRVDSPYPVTPRPPRRVVRVRKGKAVDLMSPGSDNTPKPAIFCTLDSGPELWLWPRNRVEVV